MIDVKTNHATGRIWQPPDLTGVELHDWHFTLPATGPDKSVIRPAHFHTDYQLGCVLSGAISNRYRRENHWLAEGQFYLIPPGEVHAENQVGEQPLNFSFALIPAATVAWATNDPEAAQDNSPLLSGLTVADSCLNERVASQFMAFQRATQTGASTLERESTLVDLLSGLRMASARPPVDQVATDSRAVGIVKEYLHEHYDRKVTLTDLTGEANLSKYHLLRLFSKQMGISIHAYQTQLRIIKAKELLRTRNDLGSLAVELGFTDQAHFTKTFKRFTAQTPAQFYKESNLIQKSTD